MKKSIYYFPVFIMLVVSSLFVSCNDDDETTDSMKSNTITDIAAADPNFSILVEALKKAGLDDDLANTSSNLTVFAPTNAAFTALLAELKVASLSDIPKETLTKVLLYHVKSDKSLASQIKTGYYSTLASGPAEASKLSLYVDMTTTKINGRSKITKTDIMADNGVIHVVDKVLLPMSIADHAVANESAFSSLVAALSAAKLVPALNDMTKTYTVFAPTNVAFNNLLMKLGVGLKDLSAETLSPILLYHVVNGYVPSSAVSAGYVPTLSSAFGKSLSLQLSVTGGVKLNNTVNVISTDVVATNGIIHVIDGVLLPQNVVEMAQQNSMFSTLVLAVVKADLASTLAKAGPYTVFAPTNDAFSALFKTLGVSGIDALSKEALTPILLAHVVSGNVQSGSLTSGMVPTLNTAKSLNVVVGGSGVTIDGSVKVVKADVQGSNGVIHVIDKVIVP
jgi:transforming growth factor-beta-induced protein